ncbi:MAG: hypothetical protein ABJC39_04730 [Chloroflexota bacterium]
MTDRNLRYVVTALAGLLVLVVAVTLLILVGRGRTGTTSPTRSPVAIGSAASGAPSAAATPKPTVVSATPSPEISAPPSASAAPSVVASGSPAPGSPAQLTFLGLKLDASADPASKQRIISFRSDGAGTITAKLATSSPQGTTHMCLRIGTKQLSCKDWASGTFTGKTSQAHANWSVTLKGNGVETPTVDLTVTFQAAAPAVTIRNARFDGTAFPDTNGIQARFQSRAPGEVHLVADWGGHPFTYDVELVDESTGAGTVSFKDQGPSTNVDQVIPVAAANWRLVLQNSEAGFGTTDLTATIHWP